MTPPICIDVHVGRTTSTSTKTAKMERTRHTHAHVYLDGYAYQLMFTNPVNTIVRPWEHGPFVNVFILRTRTWEHQPFVNTLLLILMNRITFVSTRPRSYKMGAWCRGTSASTPIRMLTLYEPTQPDSAQFTDQLSTRAEQVLQH